MKIMGLPGWLQWLCWFLQALLFNTVYIVLLLCMYTYLDPPIFVYSNGCILFLFFFLYAFSLISLAFLISTLFAKGESLQKRTNSKLKKCYSQRQRPHRMLHLAHCYLCILLHGEQTRGKRRFGTDSTTDESVAYFGTRFRNADHFYLRKDSKR